MSFDSRFRLAGVLAAAALAAATLAPPAWAQSIDYGALETLFGEPVTTGATGTPQRVSEAPVTMEILTAEDIRRSGATDIPGALRHLAGVDVMRISPSQAEVAVRGYNQPMADSRLMVLVNGRQVFANIFSTVLWSTIPVQLDEIRQIEVVKGPNSALYGFNAAAGVINIVTYNPLYDDANSLRLRGGTNDNGEISTVGTLRSGRSAVRLSAGGVTAADPEPVVRSPADLRARTGTQRAMGAADAMMQLADQTQMRIEAGALRDHGRYFGLQLPMRNDIDTVSGKVQLLSETAIGLVDASLYHNHIGARAFTPVTDGPASFREDTTVASLKDLFKLGARDSVRLTAEARHSAVPTFLASGGDLTADIGSLGGMWDHVVNDQVSVLSALRLDSLKLGRTGRFLPAVPFTNDDYDRWQDGYSFNEAALWRATPQDSLRASVGRGLQLPSLGEYGTMNAGPPPVTAFGNPNLLPSSVMSVELSYDRLLAELDANARLSVFHQWSDHLRGWSRPHLDSRGRPVQFEREIGSSRTTGLEAGLQGQIGPRWRWGGNLTWQGIQDKFVADTQGTDYAHGTPRLKGNAHLGYTAGAWEADLWGGHASATRQPTDAPGAIPRPERIPATVTLSPRLGYRISESVSLDLTAETLWNHRDNPAARTQRNILMSLLVRY